MDKPWKVITAFVGVFIAGAVFGGFFTLRAPAQRVPPPARPLGHLPSSDQPRKQVAGPQMGAQGRSNPITPQLMRQFSKSLELTPEQRKKMRPILGRAGEDFQRLREDNLADVARVNERMYADVSGVLTPEQRAKLQEMRQRIEDRFQAERQRRAEAQAASASKKAAERAAAAKAAPKNPK